VNFPSIAQAGSEETRSDFERLRAVKDPHDSDDRSFVEAAEPYKLDSENLPFDATRAASTHHNRRHQVHRNSRSSKHVKISL
jgi:hypothetical protein